LRLFQLLKNFVPRPSLNRSDYVTWFFRVTIVGYVLFCVLNIAQKSILITLKDDVSEPWNIESRKRMIERDRLQIRVRFKVCKLSFIHWWTFGTPVEWGWVITVAQGLISLGRRPAFLNQKYLHILAIKIKKIIRLILTFARFPVFLNFLFFVCPVEWNHLLAQIIWMKLQR
jgi:hypothetical protein